MSSLKSNKYRLLLISLRFSIIFFLTTLLINPYIIIHSFDNKTIDIIIDNSKSMNINSSILKNDINKLTNWGKKNSIEFDYYLFGDSLRSISSVEEITFEDSYTSFTNLFNSYNGSNQLFLLTDGLNNHGKDSFIFENFEPINILGYGEKKISEIDISLAFMDTTLYKDSIKVDFLLSKNISQLKISGDIYLSNNLNQKVIIGKYEMDKENIEKISLLIPKNLTDVNNRVFINSLDMESNLDNNNFSFMMDENNYSKKKLLMISGSISQNTSFIKNMIKNNLYDYEINHLFRINQNLWNDEVGNYDFEDYNLIVLDDFPIYNNDSKIINNLVEKSEIKILYFLGPNNINSNYILDYCNCNFSKSNKTFKNEISNEIFYNDNYYFLYPNEVNFNLKCENEKLFLYDNKNAFITINDNLILFLIPNINSLSFKSSEDKLFFDDLILSIIDNEVYSNNRLFELSVDSSNIYLNQPLNINLEFFNDFEIENLYLNVYKDNLMFKRINDFKKGNNRLFTKQILFESSGDFRLEAAVTLNNTYVVSNFINLSVNELDKESIDKGINMELLSIISNNTDGLFYENVYIDEFLENIEISNVNNVNYNKYDFKNYSYMLLFLIVLLSFEWYLRNKVGLV